MGKTGKKGFDPGQVQNLLVRGVTESGVGVEPTPSLRKKKVQSDPTVVPEKRKKLDGDLVATSVRITPELRRELLRFQLEYRLEHEDMNGKDTGLSGAIEYLLRGALKMPQRA